MSSRGDELMGRKENVKMCSGRMAGVFHDLPSFAVAACDVDALYCRELCSCKI